ncbi:hypothetical protein [Deinococcus taklimakanensis]
MATRTEARDAPGAPFAPGVALGEREGHRKKAGHAPGECHSTAGPCHR